MYSRQTKLFGILGFPLGHTLSPWIHNHLFSLSGFDGVYLVFEDQFWDEKGVSSLLDLKVEGVSVTIPFKEWAFSVADTACEASAQMKASNTLCFADGKISAHNTDGEGAIRSILKENKKLLSPEDSSSILVIGSGGSAKGILFSLVRKLKENAANHLTSIHSSLPKGKIRILARNKSAVMEIIRSLNAEELISSISKEEAMEERKNISLTIHTTPVGMKGVGGEPILNRDFFHKHSTLFDIVYNPLETDLVKEAKTKKAKIIPGYSMLLYQGIRQFELFTKMEVEKKWIGKIESILLKELKKRK
ncbi:shikimate dehydrogenase family protein [Leptospira ilyithenensis]|uniref:Shikimate dehydrogenase n=1 Tax=Leptospira ilyithenensis TaxID=2484901 RepID=A0A4R9LNW5_9LEPT|nr:shikimate dehydrogenase [Leptospira ilyithenensis]TGN10529.1 shikimate dehydrogenase [Leptospira ilyithenensis]